MTTSLGASDRVRTVVISGVCGGIGRATARCFADDGWRVLGLDHIDPPDDDLPLTKFARIDLSDGPSTAHVIQPLVGQDPVDALINNAAIQLNRPLVQTSDDEWDLVMNTNVRAAFQLIRTLHRQLADARGAVVNVSSVHALATSPNVAAYAISKAALAGLTRSAALELAPSGVRCNAVLPGAVLTPMLLDGLSRRQHPDGPEGTLAELVARTPLGFVATPEDIAPSVLHLADGTRSAYMTGQMMVVDGGALLRLGTE